jgi:DNA polymerase III gamma/tau subunit
MEELRLHKAEIIARLKTEISRGCSVVKRGTGDFTQVYRPCRISEMVGNEEAKRIIAKIFKENCVPHSLFFHGLRGTGKTTLARIIELGLNCEKGPSSEPCCECAACNSIIKRNGYAPAREINAGG